MNAALRWIAGLGAMALLVVAMAGPANAATPKVKLRNQATGTKLMTKEASSLVSMKVGGRRGPDLDQDGRRHRHRHVLAGNGLVAEVNTARAAFMVRMGFFTAKPNQKWFELAA